MGAFFTSEYDLYSEARENPTDFFGRLRLALRATGRSDAEDDVKGAVQEILTARTFEEAAMPCQLLLGILQDAIGVTRAVEKE
jgi:hypothetical protein